MMASLFVLIFACSFLLMSCLSFDDAAGTVSLSISQGDLLGKRIDAYDNRTGYGFLGIPFGAPPVGQLRFAKPLPAQSWKGVRNVTVKGDACPAIGELTYKVPEGGPMSEDCLHAYVYSSTNCLTKGGCAIMWVLHGGRYNFESPVSFIDEVIVHNFASDGQDVVVIIPAYRLQNFGFLNIAPGMKTSAPPNVAVWDLLLAMQWTHREAHHFGGDRNKITIFGHSAGAQFADVISTSPHFTGLYRGIVMMSGADSAYEAGIKANSLASWLTATMVGCASDDTDRSDVVVVEQVIACLREKPWEEIVAANVELNSHPEDYHGPHADGPGGILPLSPKELSSDRIAVPVMIGTTSAESHFTKYALDADGTADLNKVAELCEAFAYGQAYDNPAAMTKQCLDYYMQDDNIKSFQQDTQFFIPTYVAARDFAKRGENVYLFSFSYKDIGSAFKKFVNLDKDEHPSHSEDYVYILGMHRGNFTPRDYEIEKIYSGMVLDFVKTGYPNPGSGQPKWKPFNRLSRQYYDIDFDDALRMPGMKKGYNAGAVKLWVDDAEKYGGSVTPPDEFPAHVDRFYQMDVIDAYASHYLNFSLSKRMSKKTKNDNYQTWVDYVNNRRYKYLQGLERSIGIKPLEAPTTSMPENHIFMQIFVVCVFAVLLFILIRLFLHIVRVCDERRMYQRL